MDSAADGEELWKQLNDGFRFILDRFAGADNDLPIIATLAEFEEVTGRTAAETVGNNCRFLNAGCENDPETVAFMRKISSSSETAAQFRCEYPKGKQFVLENARTARTNRT